MEKDAKTREKEATFPNFRDGNCSGIVEKIFRSNERITSLEQVGTTSWKSCEGGGGVVVMHGSIEKKFLLPCFSLFIHSHARAHIRTHARTFSYVHTYRSLFLRISISTCLYNVLSLCFYCTGASRAGCRAGTIFHAKISKFTAQRHLRRLS